MSYVYFFVTHGPLEQPMCKIGFTRSHPMRRLNEVQGMCPTELDLLAYVDGSLMLERKLHRTFAPLNYHGEWFVLEHKLAAFLEKLMPNGKCGGAPTPMAQFNAAVSEAILGDYPSNQSTTMRDWLSSADTREWLNDGRLSFSGLEALQ